MKLVRAASYSAVSSADCQQHQTVTLNKAADADQWATAEWDDRSN